MIFAVDIGNTNIVFGIFGKNGELLGNCRLNTDSMRTTDEYAATIMLLLKNREIDFGLLSGMVISSVVPPLVYTFSKLATKYFNIEPIVVGPGIKTGVPVKFENPKEVGADRIVNAAAAIKYYGSPCIVVDFGTATTFDVINAKGEYIGGLISPGIKLSINALHSKTAKLPEIEIEKCQRVVGNTTTSSMKSGIYFGYLSLIDGIIKRIINEQFAGRNIQVVATGGLGSIYIGESEYIKEYEPNLTLYGLRSIYEKNSS
jgi:type III pantothenate kinase